MESIETAQYATICNKYNMPLRFDKNSKCYTLKFNCKNSHFNFDELISFNIYNLIEKLNPDLIHKIEILKEYSKDEIDVLFIFKRVGAELGLAQKYMALHVEKKQIENNIYINSSHINYSKDNFEKRLEPLICEFSEMILYNTHLSMLDLYYKFNINTNEDLPIYMENYIGLMIKKIFFNLKVFIDNFDNNNRIDDT